MGASMPLPCHFREDDAAAYRGVVVPHTCDHKAPIAAPLLRLQSLALNAPPPCAAAAGRHTLPHTSAVSHPGPKTRVVVVITDLRLCFESVFWWNSGTQLELWLCFSEVITGPYLIFFEIVDNLTHEQSLKRSKSKTQKDFEKVMFRCCCFPPWRSSRDDGEQQLTNVTLSINIQNEGLIALCIKYGRTAIDTCPFQKRLS
jgi:hypothetical protein